MRRSAMRTDPEAALGPRLWERQDFREALGARDIGAFYRLLARLGFSQYRIAQITGQAQSDISEIVGGRRVTSYEVLVRIAAGFGIPRGYLGLAYGDSTDVG